jgi:transposase
MPTAQTNHSTLDIAPAASLHLAFELSASKWLLAFGTASSNSFRQVGITAKDLIALDREIARARKHFSLPEAAPVYSLYEAGRDGFWLHRRLLSQGIQNLIVDPASIQVNRKARRAKNDTLDVRLLLSQLQRYLAGERNHMRTIHVPSPEDEDRRLPEREQISLKGERTSLSNQIHGHLACVGLDVRVDGKLPERLAALRLWNGKPIFPELMARLLRLFERWKLADKQIKTLEREQIRRLKHDDSPQATMTRKLMGLRAIGVGSSSLFVNEIFGWRQIRNRRQLGSLTGNIPSPYDSGQSHREQGITKSGNRHVRWMAVEIAWMWVQSQPKSALTQWFHRRFGDSNPRTRKVGIVALSRKLLVALWKYLEFDIAPEGATIVHWTAKFGRRAPAESPEVQLG